MCGRAYETYTEEELAFRYLNKKTIRLPDLRPNYNLSPTQITYVLREENGQREFAPMRWGLVPSWAKSLKDVQKYSLINAKAEEISQKRSYKEPFLKRRCILPVSGFFEWQRSENKKQPFAIYLKDLPIMSIAGVWEHWTSHETGEIIESFSIITTAANSFMAKIHDRMPVILSQMDEQYWLDSKNTNADSLQRLLRPCDPSLLGAIEVSTLVNSPRNNSPEVLKPISPLPTKDY